VFLQVVTDAGNVGGDFHGVGEPHARYFAQSGVRFLRRLRVNADAYSALFRAALQCR